MDWLFVLVLTPIIIAAFVALIGFVGCGQTLPLDGPTSATDKPMNVTATALSISVIRVAWAHATVGVGTGFTVRRQKNAPGSGLVQISATALTLDDTGLEPNTSYTYEVVASEPGKSTSAPSDAVTASTLAAEWKVVYDAEPTNEEALDFKGRCLVQRVGKAVFTTAGTRIRVTLRAGPGSDLAVHRLFLSGAGATPDDVDSTSASLVDMRPGGVVVPAGSLVTLAPVNYAVDSTRDLLLAFDLSTTAAAVRKASHAGSNAFHLANASQAALADRSPGYAKVADTMYLVKRVEVWTGAIVDMGDTPLPCFSAALTGDGGSPTADCVVVRIPSVLLSNSGSRVRLTLRSGGGVGVAIRGLSIAAAATTPNEWDSGPDLKKFPDGGVSIPPNTPVTLDPVDYALDHTKDLIVAFDLTGYANVIKQGSVTGPKVFTKPSAAGESALQIRSASYATANNSVVLIERIDVGN